MNRAMTAATATLLLSTSIAAAGGLDRTGLPIGILFEDGNYGEISFSTTTPTLRGEGVGLRDPAGNFLFPPGTGYDDVGESFTNLGLGVKVDITDKLSAAVIFEQPFGSDIRYDGEPTTSELGGTEAIARTDMISALLRYKFTERISAHGGVRVARSGGDIILSGLAYGGLNGYEVELEENIGVGYTLGVAYEIPDIALRVALTYNSTITHEFDTVEFAPTPAGFMRFTSTTDVDLPQSVALDFQTGVAADTLIFGQVRWAEWSEFKIDPEAFELVTGGARLVDLDDEITYTLGVGRKFSDAFSGSFSMIYEEPETSDRVSPLAPTNGLLAYNLGGRWNLGNGASFSGGVRYSIVGDAEPQTASTARASFEDNHAITLGFRLGFAF